MNLMSHLGEMRAAELRAEAMRERVAREAHQRTGQAQYSVLNLRALFSKLRPA